MVNPAVGILTAIARRSGHTSSIKRVKLPVNLTRETVLPKNRHNNLFLFLLGLPSFGLTFAVTILTAFLPIELKELTSPLFIGIIIGAEGFFGLFAPLLFGFLSDRATSVLGRFEYLVPATAAIGSSLMLMGMIENLYVIVPMVALFYTGYFAYLAPYWAIYPDLVPDEEASRSRSVEGILRVVGAFFALLSGGFLLTLWEPLPFVISAGLVIGVTFSLLATILKHSDRPIRQHVETFRESLQYLREFLARNKDVRNLAIANSFWNATLQSIQAFVVLFFTQGLHRSTHFVSGVIFPVAAIGILIMAPLSGRLGDRFGHVKTLTIASAIFGFGCLIAGLTQQYWVIFVVPIVAAAATFTMILPYATLMKLIGTDRHGAASGLFGLSRGIGSFLGPLLTGVAVVTCRGLFPSTDGYAAFWWVAGLLTIVSLFFTVRIREPQS
ncbi:MAG TPA: MFS transporter [Candidatus Saccharimonadales bacterium]|nr:MFS transporter [Candidatus Saccharimonadales bacterium]